MADPIRPSASIPPTTDRLREQQDAGTDPVVTPTPQSPDRNSPVLALGSEQG